MDKWLVGELGNINSDWRHLEHLFNQGYESYTAYITENNISNIEELGANLGLKLEGFTKIDMLEFFLNALNNNKEIEDKLIGMLDLDKISRLVSSGEGESMARFYGMEVTDKMLSVSLSPVHDGKRNLMLHPWFNLSFFKEYTFYPKSKSYNSSKVRDYSKFKRIKDKYNLMNANISGLWGEGAYHGVSYPVISSHHIAYVIEGMEDDFKEFLMEGLVKLSDSGYLCCSHSKVIKSGSEVVSSSY